MNLRYCVILFVVILANITFLSDAKSYDSTQVNTYLKFDKDAYYAGEVGICTVFLEFEEGAEVSILSSYPEINCKGKSFSFLSQVDSPYLPKRKLVDGTVVKTHPLVSYAFIINESCTPVIESTQFQIGITDYEIVEDPFYGIIKRPVYRKRIITPAPQKISVKQLKRNKENISFSGAVGSYKINLEVPRQTFIVNDETEVFVRIQGKGILDKNILPEYTGAFGQTIKIKSIDCSDRLSFNGKDIVSSLNFSLRIIPSEVGEQQIGRIGFSFFNPDTSEYEYIETKPTTIYVNSSVVKRDVMEI